MSLMNQVLSQTTGYNAFHWVTYGSKQYINKHQSSLISSNKIIIPKCQQIDVNKKSYDGHRGGLYVTVVKILKKIGINGKILGESGGQTFKGSDREKCQF